MCVCTHRYYEQGGFSTLAVETVDMEMGEVLAKVLRKRRLQMQGPSFITLCCMYIACTICNDLYT